MDPVVQDLRFRASLYEESGVYRAIPTSKSPVASLTDFSYDLTLVCP